MLFFLFNFIEQIYKYFISFQSSDLDALLCRQELDRLNRIGDDDNKDSISESTTPGMEELFEVTGPNSQNCRPQANFVSVTNSPGSTVNFQQQHHINRSHNEDIFLRPPYWEDITSSIQKLDPENADMLASQSHLSLNLNLKLETEAAVIFEGQDQVSPPNNIRNSSVCQNVRPLDNPTLHMLETPTLSNSSPSSSSNFQKRLPCLSLVNDHNRNNNNLNKCNCKDSLNSGSSNSNSLKINSYSSNNDDAKNNEDEDEILNSKSDNKSLSQPIYGPMTRLMYNSPLTPPISDPGSPLRRTPPPPYPRSGPLNVPTASSTKFNRRNNPELEKRRVHHCDFLGKNDIKFIAFLSRFVRKCIWLIFFGQFICRYEHLLFTIHFDFLSSRFFSFD